MKKYFYIIGLVILILSFTGCNLKYATPEKTINTFYQAKKDGNHNEWFRCFTQETQTLLRKYWVLTGISESEKTLKKDESLNWKIMNSRIEGNSAELKIRYFNRSHESTDIIIDLIKDNREWKIDKTKAIRKAIEMNMEDKIIKETLK